MLSLGFGLTGPHPSIFSSSSRAQGSAGHASPAHTCECTKASEKRATGQHRPASPRDCFRRHIQDAALRCWFKTFTTDNLSLHTHTHQMLLPYTVTLGVWSWLYKYTEPVCTQELVCAFVRCYLLKLQMHSQAVSYLHAHLHFSTARTQTAHSYLATVSD